MSAEPNSPNTVAELLEDYEQTTTLPVQWGDMDAFGHVNNVVYIRWIESARIDLLNALQSSVTMDAGGIGPILASVKCDYKRQLHFPDTVYIGSRRGKMGRTSADIEHVVVSERQQAVVATGVSVLVIFDYDTNRPVRIPDDLRAD